ncbi:toxin-antitoxin system TumE family protein [Duganella sp. PWIR1]
MKNQKAKSLIHKRMEHAPNVFTETVVWELPQAVIGSTHRYKYRLAYVVNSSCVLRYDNEARKGDHRHYGETQSPYHFSSLRQLLDDFRTDIARWNNENHQI